MDPAEKGIENEGIKSTLDESINAELSSDSHHYYSKEKEEQKSNESISETSYKNKEPIEKRVKNKEYKSAPDQSRSAKLPTHQNNGEVKGHKLNESVSETASKKEEPVEKGVENEEKKSKPAQSRSAELPTDSHQNNSKEKEGHKWNIGVNETAAKNKDSVEERIKNEDHKSTTDQSRIPEKPTDSHQNNSKEKEGRKSNESLNSHQNNSKEKEGHKSNESVNETAVKNKDSVEEGIENEEKESTTDQSRSDKQSTDSHQNNSKDEDGRKSNEGVSEIASKNKDPAGKGIENEGIKSTLDESRNAELSSDFHHNYSKEKEGHKSNESLDSHQNNSKEKEGHKSKKREEKLGTKEEKKSTSDQSRNAKQSTDSHQNTNKEEVERKSNEGVSDTAPNRKESAGKRIENEERKSTSDQSRNAEQSTDSHQNSSKEEKRRKSNEGVSATASKNKEPAGKGIENEEKESTIDQSRNAEKSTDYHQNNSKDESGRKSNEGVSDTAPNRKESAGKRIENEERKSTVINREMLNNLLILIKTAAKKKRTQIERKESAEQPTDSHQNSSKEKEGHKWNIGVNETAAKNKDSVEERIKNEDHKSTTDQSRIPEKPTDSHQNNSKEKEGRKSNESLNSHQNNSKEKEGHKSNESVNETAVKNKDSVEEGIENEEKESTTDQSRSDKQSTDSHQTTAKTKMDANLMKVKEKEGHKSNGSLDSHQNNSKEKEGHKSKESVNETAVKNKDSVEEGIENEEKESTTDQSRSDKQSTDFHQNSSKEKQGRKSNEGVSDTTSKNKKREEKLGTKEEKKSTPDQYRNAEQSTDSHQNTNKEEVERKSNEGVSETAPKKKESAGKRIENKERKSTSDQSRNAEQSTDSHQNSSKEENRRKSNEGVSATASKNKEPAGKGIENEEKESTIDKSRNAEKSTDYHQNNSKDEGERKSNEGVSDTAPNRKESAGKRIENEERKSTSDQSRNAEQSTDSHQNSSKEEKRRKSKEGVSATASKNKEPAGKGIENEEKESTLDESINAELSSDSHHNYSKEKEEQKSNESISETSYKNKEPLEKRVKNEEYKSAPDRSRSAKLPTHQNNGKVKGHKLNESVSETASKKEKPVEKGVENEEKKSKPAQSRIPEKPTDSHQNNSKGKEGHKSNESLDSHQNNSKEKEGHKSNESVNETAVKNKDSVEKGVENEEKKSKPAQSRIPEKPTDSHQNNSKGKEGHKSNESLDSHQNNSKEKEGHKSNESVNETAVKNKDSVEEGIENEDKKSTSDQSRSADMRTDSHQSNNKEKYIHKSNEGLNETISKNKEPVGKGVEEEDKKELKELMKKRYENEGNISTPDEYKNYAVDSNPHEKSREEKGKGISEKDDRKKWKNILLYKNDSNLSSSKNGTSKENKKFKERHMSNNSQNFKTTRLKDNKASEKEEKMSTVDIAIDRKEKQKYISKNKDFVKGRTENEEEKSKPAEFRNAELSKIFHGKNIKEMLGNKLNKSVTTSENMDLEKGGFKNEDKNSTPMETSKSKLPGYSHKQNNRLNEDDKFNENICETKHEIKEFMKKGKENKVGKSTLVASISDPHKNDTKEKEGNKSNVIVSETTSEVSEEPREHIKNGKENQIAQKNMESVGQNREDKSGPGENSCGEEKNSPNQEQNIHRANVENQTSPNNMENIEYNEISEGELSTVQKSQTRHSEEKMRDRTNERENKTKNDNHSSMRNLKGEGNIPKRTKTSSEKDKIEGDKIKKWTKKEPDNKNETKKKYFENKREIQTLLGTKNQADELRVKGMFCNNALMREQNPFDIENDSQPSPESSLNYDYRDYEDSLFPLQPNIDTKSKEKQTLIQKGLEHNEYFFSEHKDDFPKEDNISFNENKELSLDSLPEENITLSNHISACELLFYPINVSEYLSKLTNFGNDQKTETKVLDIDRPIHELLLKSSNMPPHSPFNLEDTDNVKNLETQNFSEISNNKDLEDSRIYESKVAHSMQTNSKVDCIKQVKNEVSKSLNDSANKTSESKLAQNHDEALHLEFDTFANVKRTKTESEILLEQQNLVKKAEVNETVVNFLNNEETMANKCNDSNINKTPNFLISNTMETSLLPSFYKNPVIENWDVSANTDKKEEMQAVPKDIYKRSAVKKRKILNKKIKRTGGENSLHPKSEKRNVILQPTSRYKGVANGYSPNIEIPEIVLSKVNQQKPKISKKSSVESAIDEVCSLLSLQSIDDSKDFESKPLKTYNAFRYTYFNRKVIEPPLVNDERKEASAKNNKEFVSNLDEQLAETSQPKNRSKAKTQECMPLPVSSTAKNPDFTSDSGNFRSGLFEPKQRSEMTSKNISSSYEQRTQLDQALKIIDQNYDSNATKATEILKVEATNNRNQLVKSIESITLENQATNPFLRADAQRDQIYEVKNIPSPNCSTYTTKGVATQVSNEASFMTGEGKTQRRSGEGLIVQQGNFVFQCALNEKSKCRLQFTSEPNSANTSDPELFKYNLVFERDAFKKGRC
ncbi:hypothetical protein JTE90_027761 [Oedothorax gibbosus]|uniref:Uncharacterized protein n=1 Tax=Oedothorax gibbosus TaxID=931172 RepID=A0AAV6V839_9ARAC|nr:hypothetical protein JTE90_027761 [Oedothorax gibbosus]